MIRGLTRSIRTTVALTVVFVFAGCGSETALPAENALRDDLGRAVVIERPVRRIVSLAPNVTEILYAIGAGSNVVGADDFSNYPPEARTLSRLGGMSPSVEKIAELRPDVVFASTSANQPSLPAVLDSLRIPLFVTRADRLSEVGPLIERIARVAAVDPGDVVSEFQRKLEQQREVRTPRPRVLFVVWHDPLFISGRETFADDLITLVGGENYVDQSVKGWPQFSFERLIADPPDIILVAGPQQVLDAVRSRVGREEPVYQLVSEDIYSRPGPRLADAAKEMNAVLDRWSARPVNGSQSIRLIRASGLTAAIVIVSAVVSLQFGASEVDLRSAFDDPRSAEIFTRIRLPRVLLAAGVGFILGITGSAFQTLLRNPLADPFVLGVSGGAAAGATLVAASGRSSSAASVAVASFIGSIVAIFAVLALARASRGFDTSRLVLAGLVMNAMFSAIITLALSFTFGSDLQSALRWMMGGFFRASWQDVFTVAIAGALAFAFLVWKAGELRLMLLGAEDARARGVDTKRLERGVFIVSSLATAAAVAAAGVIGFVGLMVPHAVRLAVPGDFRWNLPLSGLAGAALMIGADLLARMILVPAELPVGALTACIGVPFFFVLLRRVL